MNEEKRRSRYENRELSWLQFNKRVLGEARDKLNPLLERGKFLSISASNLDEFFMVRIASIKDMEDAGFKGKDIAGMTPEEQLSVLSKETHSFIRGQYRTMKRSLLPKLTEEGIVILTDHEKLSKQQAEFADRFFDKQLYPILTPMAVDSVRPFPLIKNKALHLAVLLVQKEGKGIRKNTQKKKRPDIALIPVPAGIPRLVRLPVKEDGSVKEAYILLEEILKRNVHKLFTGCQVLSVSAFRLIRNADLSIEEEEAEDLLIEIEKKLKKRQWGQVIRLDLESGMDKKLTGFLVESLHVKEMSVFELDGPVDLTFFMELYSFCGHDEYKYEPFEPARTLGLLTGGDLFERIRQQDILLYHPYESFEPVVEFVRSAAKDPKVLAIKQTLYRVSGHSPIVEALSEAAIGGKQVTVLVELKARFDEAHNIEWARKLEQAGCNVIYGLVGLKTHCKITMVVRREGEKILRYIHLGTGNYNDSTARLYSDLGLFTSDERIGEDATALFNMLSGYSEPRKLSLLCMAPLWLKDRFLDLIRREEKNAKAGKSSGIIAKMNSLCDRDVIDALYEAAEAGVRIDLIIRGICCLKTGLPKLSGNITVHSIVGRFLEHARIFRFENGGEPEFYLSSADWMPRNLERRVELLFPVLSKPLKERLHRILTEQLNDTVKGRSLRSDGTYKKADLRSEERFDSQKAAMETAEKTEESGKAPFAFIPQTSHGTE